MQCNLCFFETSNRELFSKKSKKLCKKCDAHYSKSRRRTKKGIVSSMYSHQKANSVKRGHHPPSYTQKELFNWLCSQKLFHELYDMWVVLDYDVGSKPSCDRRDCLKGYSLSNIELMTWDENHAKATIELSSGLVGAKQRGVFKLSLNNELICSYKSINDAARAFGYDDGLIGKVCKGVYATAYGYK